MNSTDQSPKFVFVCYSRADMEIVDRVLEELEKQGHRMWIDRTGIVGSQTWRAKIVEAMQQCRAVLFFGSRASYGSRHVATELTLAEEALKPIVPVLLDDSPPDGDVRYFLARLHHLKLCGSDLSCAIKVIHDTLLRIADPSGFSSSPLPRHPRHRGSRALFAVLALPLLAAAGWILWNYYSNPGDEDQTKRQTAQNRVAGTKEENTLDSVRKPFEEPPKEPNEVSSGEPPGEPQKDPPGKPSEAPPQEKQTGFEDRSASRPVTPPPPDTAWMLPGADAVVIQAIQRGVLTLENGGVLQLSVDYDIGQTVRIGRQTGERIQISSSLPGMGIGWLKKEDANQYLKRKP